MGRMLRRTILKGLASSREVKKSPLRICHQSSDLKIGKETTM